MLHRCILEIVDFFWQHTILKQNLLPIRFSYINIFRPWKYTVSGMFLLLAHTLNHFFFFYTIGKPSLYVSLTAYHATDFTDVDSKPTMRIPTLPIWTDKKIIWPFQAMCFGLWGISPLKVEAEVNCGWLNVISAALSAWLWLKCKSRLKERLVYLTSSIQNKKCGGQASAHISNYAVYFLVYQHYW